MDEAMWALGRGAGVVLLVLMTVNLLLGIATHGRGGGGLQRFGVVLLHRNVALLSVVLLVVHVGSLLLDPDAGIDLLDVVVPFLASWSPVWVGFGTLALDLALAVVVTALLRHRIGVRAFTAVHRLAYLLWPMAVLHGIGAGSDSVPVLVVSCLATAAVGGAVVWRLRHRLPARRLPEVAR